MSRKCIFFRVNLKCVSKLNLTSAKLNISFETVNHNIVVKNHTSKKKQFQTKVKVSNHHPHFKVAIKFQLFYNISKKENPSTLA